VRSVVLVALVSCANIARADRASDAREHYQNATAHFAVGEFAEAAVEFQAAFKLKPGPALLFNAAQAYRLAENLPKALILYKNYLQLFPDESNIPEVRSQIAKLQETLAAAPKSPQPPQQRHDEPPPPVYSGRLGADGRVTVSVPCAYLVVVSPGCETKIADFTNIQVNLTNG